MPEHLAEASEEYFRNVVSPIKEHPDWIVDEEFGVSISEAVEQAATSSKDASEELRFKHVATSGQLYVRLPDLGSPPGAMEGLLEQPLDPALDQVDSSLAKEIGEIHRSIVENDATQYITGQCNSYTILVVSVPLDYSDQELSKTIDAVSTISRHIAEFHNEIRESIDTTQ